MEAIAEELGVSTATAARWLARMGLGKRFVTVEVHGGEADTPSTGRGKPEIGAAAARRSPDLAAQGA